MAAFLLAICLMHLPPSRHRPLFSLALAGLLVAVVLAGVLGIVIPTRAPPSFQAPSVAGKRLATRLLLVIVDGIRYDVATDPERMPQFSEAMRRESGGELWAGSVSMTTSAVLSLGTGQRGSFEQIVSNVDPKPPPFDSWLSSAKAAGLTLMSVGDPAWGEMYGPAFSERRVDPAGVAIDVDFNPITFRDARELRARSPDVLVVHFVTPDHQAHAYTVPSRRYANHIRRFDADLFQFLRETGPEWTVVVVGDHGAADSGTHGADVPIQRRSVLFASGPGIAPGVRLDAIDQVDVAGTLAALLGLPTPAHSRGHVLVDLLSIAPEAKVALACNDAARAQAFAAASGLAGVPGSADCTKTPKPLVTARDIVSRVDRAMESRGGIRSPAVPWLIAVTVLLGVLTALVAVGRRIPAEIGAALTVGALGVFLTWGVERLPGFMPWTVTVALFVLGNVPALLALLVPGRVACVVERAPWLGLAVFPGFLVAACTHNAQPEAYVAVAVSSVLVVLIGGLDAQRPTLRALSATLRPAHLVLLVLCLLLMFLPGTRKSDVYPAWFRRDPGLVMTCAILLMGLTSVVFALRSRHRRRFQLALGLGSLAIAAFVLRRFVPPLPGRILLVACGLAALFLALRRQRLAALLMGMATYSWVSRDAEIVGLCATVLVADGVGAAFARHRLRLGAAQEPLGPAQLVLIACFLFGVAFVQRVGIQGALDFGAMDWGAAGFGDPHVTGWIVGGALGLKYSIGLWLALGAFASELGPKHAPTVLRVAFLTFLLRTVVLAVMFVVAGSSFWTGLHVLGDLPFAMLWLVAAGLAWAALGGAHELRLHA